MAVGALPVGQLVLVAAIWVHHEDVVVSTSAAVEGDTSAVGRPDRGIVAVGVVGQLADAPIIRVDDKDLRVVQ